MYKASEYNPKDKAGNMHWLYNKYAPMLLGYINGVIQDQTLAEKHLVKILSSFMLEYDQADGNAGLTWLQLWQYAKNYLAQLEELNLQKNEGGYGKVATLPNQYITLLSDAERRIFTAVYYHGKSISYLAKSTSESEETIRCQLKSSLDKIRAARGN